MRPTLHVLKPGLMTTVQDLGRAGFQNLGIGTMSAPYYSTTTSLPH